MLAGPTCYKVRVPQGGGVNFAGPKPVMCLVLLKKITDGSSAFLLANFVLPFLLSISG